MSKYCAVIVDSRPIDPHVIQAHMVYLPGDWDLFLFIQGNSVGLKEKFDCRAALCPPIRSLNDYNAFMTSANFWEHLQEYERVLIFQQDSRILRQGVDEFLEWDYVGSPWKWQSEPRFGGNGGISVRNPEKCLSLVRQKPWHISLGYEDVYFTNHLNEVGGKVAPYEVCKRFGCETMFELGTFAYHAIEKYLTPDEVNQIKTQYLK